MHSEFCTVARYLIPTEAHVVCGCLQAAGIAAVVVDDQYVQSNLLLAPAAGVTFGSSKQRARRYNRCIAIPLAVSP